MKKKLILIFLCITSISFGQSKKEQIDVMKTKIDSLQNILNNCRFSLLQSKKEADSILSQTTLFVEKLRYSSLENKLLKDSTIILKQEIITLNDSIMRLNKYPSTIWGILKTKTYSGPDGEPQEQYVLDILGMDVEFQLVNQTEKNLTEYLNMKVKVFCDFFQWHTGHHNTPVLIEAFKIELYNYNEI